MENIHALRFFGDNSKIHNSTFEKCNLLNIVNVTILRCCLILLSIPLTITNGFIRGNDTKFVDNSVTNNSAGFLVVGI